MMMVRSNKGEGKTYGGGSRKGGMFGGKDKGCDDGGQKTAKTKEKLHQVDIKVEWSWPWGQTATEPLTAREDEEVWYVINDDLDGEFKGKSSNYSNKSKELNRLNKSAHCYHKIFSMESGSQDNDQQRLEEFKKQYSAWF
jgi:hypothetical protein